MPILTTPPRLLDSTGAPANGTIAVRVTTQFALGADYVLPVRARGYVVDGEFVATPAGGDFELPTTPEGVAIEIVLALTGWRSGKPDTTYARRIVSVPAGATVAWDDLPDVVPVVASGEYLVPPWALEVLTASATAETAATTAQNAADRAENVLVEDPANPGLYLIGA